MTELERALVALGSEVDFPAEPDLRPRVRERLERKRFARPLVLAVALLVVAFGIAMAVPPARSAILDFFHLGAVTVQRVETLPPAQERPLAAGLGPALTRSEAERSAGLSLVLPNFAGSPPTRYYARPGLVATLFRYLDKPVLLVELADDQAGIAKKFVAPSTFVEPVPFGQFGLWLEGAPHVVTWEVGFGPPRHIETRLAGNVLIWLMGNRTYRLESDLNKKQMLELARDITR